MSDSTVLMGEMTARESAFFEPRRNLLQVYIDPRTRIALDRYVRAQTKRKTSPQVDAILTEFLISKGFLELDGSLPLRTNDAHEVATTEG
ncbi:MAG: hypothetical protein IPF79_04845 [Ignavibacteria bacterium]|nr:hypothetical protein [Ignavibacteria bacterium]